MPAWKTPEQFFISLQRRQFSWEMYPHSFIGSKWLPNVYRSYKLASKRDSISSNVRPLVSKTYCLTKSAAQRHIIVKNEYRIPVPRVSSKCRNVKPTKKFATCKNQRQMPFTSQSAIKLEQKETTIYTNFTMRKQLECKQR